MEKTKMIREYLENINFLSAVKKGAVNIFSLLTDGEISHQQGEEIIDMFDLRELEDFYVRKYEERFSEDEINFLLGLSENPAYHKIIDPEFINELTSESYAWWAAKAEELNADGRILDVLDGKTE